MTSNARQGSRILGTLRSVDGKGAVRMEDRFDTDVEDLWSALTDPLRLARWLGEIEGDLRPGGEFRARFYASGWEGTGRIEVCERPHRLRVSTTETADSDEAGASDEHVIEATLRADGDRTVLVIEERGMPLEMVAGYGAGVQIHVEDLAAYLVGRERCDAQARFDELFPTYRELTVG